MITMLKDWKGTVEINDTQYENIELALKQANLEEGTRVHIRLCPPVKATNKASKNVESAQGTEYRITVKKWMTQKSTPEFTFMLERNNDVPMPLRIMTGTIEKETPGMVYMKLHGDMYAEKMCTCMKCGKRLTNKVSQYFGIGPECGGHNYVNPFETKEELNRAVANYRKQLQAITWEGWVIKSAITEQEEV